MKKFEIKSIKAREILDSKGEPTIEVELQIGLGGFFASVSSGTSKGKYEAKELRDQDKRYFGKGVLKAIRNVEEIIAPKLKGKDLREQEKIDELMIKLDGTKDKSRLGSNAILGVSMAVCRAGAAAQNQVLSQYIYEIFHCNRFLPIGRNLLQLPLPCFLMIEGGAHAGNELDFQEFMIIPKEKSFSKNLQIGTEIYHYLNKILEKKYGKSSTNVGMEGGFAPPLKFPEQAMDLIMEAVQKAGYTNKIGIILDVAASEFYEKKYKTKFGVFTTENLLRYYSNLIKKYPIVGLEDPFSQDDWQGFKELTENCSPLINGEQFSVIGDDLTVTNPERIKKAKKEYACNGIVIKPNQIGTITETIDAIKLAKDQNWKIFIKHRSGETNDDFIADLAVGVAADGIMAGAPVRGERVAKYNRLLKIEEKIKL